MTVPEPFSTQWVDAFNSATHTPEVMGQLERSAADIASKSAFSMSQTVLGGPSGDKSTTLRVDGTDVQMAVGADADADVSVELGYEDALALSDGTLAPMEAITAGRVRVRGDLTVLVSAQQLLAHIQPHLAGLTS